MTYAITYYFYIIKGIITLLSSIHLALTTKPLDIFRLVRIKISLSNEAQY